MTCPNDLDGTGFCDETQNGSSLAPSNGKMKNQLLKAGIEKSNCHVKSKLIRQMSYGDKKAKQTILDTLADVKRSIENARAQDIWIDILVPEGEIEPFLDYLEIKYEKDEEEEDEDIFILEDSDDRTILGFSYVLKGWNEVGYVYLACFKNRIVTLRTSAHPKGPCESVIAYLDDLIEEETGDHTVELTNFRDFIFAQLMNSYAEEFLSWLFKTTRELNSLNKRLQTEDPLVIQEALYQIHSNISEVLSPTLFLFSRFIGTIKKGGGRFIHTSTYVPLVDSAIQDVDRAMSMKTNMEATVELLSAAIRAKISDETNKVIKLLTIITTIMMPLTFLTGLYGQNFTYMPLADHRWGFFIWLGIMGMIMLTMIVIFRTKKYIN